MKSSNYTFRVCSSLIGMAMLACPLMALADPMAPPGSGDSPTEPMTPPDTDRVPYLGEKGQQEYHRYLKLPLPSAFAISQSGHFSSASGTRPSGMSKSRDPKERALESCKKNSGSECQLYAVDREVVFEGQSQDSAGYDAQQPPPPPNLDVPPPGAIPPPPAYAGNPPPPPMAVKDPTQVRFVGNLVLEHQFKSIGYMVYQDGDRIDIGDAMAGITCGASIPLQSNRMFELQIVGGFLLSSASASNGDLTFWEFPVEITAHVNHGPIRFGLGPVLHLAPMLRGDGFADSLDVDYNTTVGALASVEYVFHTFSGRNELSIGMRGNWLRLSAHGHSEDASRIGLVVSFIP